MKPSELYSTNYIKEIKFKELSKKITLIDTNRELSCSVNNIEVAYIKLNEILKLMLVFNKIPTELKREYKNTFKFIQTEVKEIKKEYKKIRNG